MGAYASDEEIERAVRAYGTMLLRLACTRLSPADAEDAVQEAFLRLLVKRPAFRDAGHEEAWLIRVTLQRCADMRRAAHRRDLPLEEAASAAAPETGNGLLDAVRALPEKYGVPIHLHYYEGWTLEEIGRMLGIPAATVGTRLARGRERLRAYGAHEAHEDV